MHTDSTLHLLHGATRLLGHELRQFQRITCAEFDTKETERERNARVKAAAKRKISSSVLVTSARQHRTLNLTRIKLHFLGDYVAEIKYVGASDNGSTQTV